MELYWVAYLLQPSKIDDFVQSLKCESSRKHAVTSGMRLVKTLLTQAEAAVTVSGTKHAMTASSSNSVSSTSYSNQVSLLEGPTPPPTPTRDLPIPPSTSHDQLMNESVSTPMTPPHHHSPLHDGSISSSNANESGESGAGTAAVAVVNTTGNSKRARLLRWMACKIITGLGLCLEELEGLAGLPLHVQWVILCEYIRLAAVVPAEINDEGPIRPLAMEGAYASPDVQFHRWVVRALARGDDISLNTLWQESGVTIDSTTACPGVDISEAGSMAYLTGHVLGNDDGDNNKVPLTRMRAQVNIEVAALHFARERYSEAQVHFERALKLVHRLNGELGHGGDGNSGDVATEEFAINEQRLRGYLSACHSISQSLQVDPINTETTVGDSCSGGDARSIFLRRAELLRVMARSTNGGTSNVQNDIVSLLLEDNVANVLPCAFRISLETELEPEALRDAVSVCNEVKAILWGKVPNSAYSSRTATDLILRPYAFKIFLQACVAATGALWPEDKVRRDEDFMVPSEEQRRVRLNSALVRVLYDIPSIDWDIVNSVPGAVSLLVQTGYTRTDRDTCEDDIDDRKGDAMKMTSNTLEDVDVIPHAAFARLYHAMDVDDVLRAWTDWRATGDNDRDPTTFDYDSLNGKNALDVVTFPPPLPAGSIGGAQDENVALVNLLAAKAAQCASSRRWQAALNLCAAAKSRLQCAVHAVDASAMTAGVIMLEMESTYLLTLGLVDSDKHSSDTELAAIGKIWVTLLGNAAKAQMPPPLGAWEHATGVFFRAGAWALACEITVAAQALPLTGVAALVRESVSTLVAALADVCQELTEHVLVGDVGNGDIRPGMWDSLVVALVPSPSIVAPVSNALFGDISSRTVIESVTSRILDCACSHPLVGTVFACALISRCFSAAEHQLGNANNRLERRRVTVRMSAALPGEVDVSRVWRSASLAAAKGPLRVSDDAVLALAQACLNRVCEAHGDGAAWAWCALGDLDYADDNLDSALRRYLWAGALESGFFARTVPWNGSTLDRIVTCLSSRQAHLQAALFCQLLAEDADKKQDVWYQRAFREVHQCFTTLPPRPPLMEPTVITTQLVRSSDCVYLSFVWDITLLELLTSQYSRVGDQAKLAVLLERARIAGTAAQNCRDLALPLHHPALPPRARVIAALKAQFFEALCREFIPDAVAWRPTEAMPSH